MYQKSRWMSPVEKGVVVPQPERDGERAGASTKEWRKVFRLLQGNERDHEGNIEDSSSRGFC